MSTRYKGSASGDRLSQSTVYNEDMIQTRHGWSDATEDSDKGLPLSVIQSTPVAVCSTSATDSQKSATIQNFSDFTLLNGREVIVYMINGNSASEPSLSINGSDFFLMESAYWNAGTFLKLRYVSVTVNGTTIQKWLVEQGATNTAAQLNGALTNYPTDWKLWGQNTDTYPLNKKEVMFLIYTSYFTSFILNSFASGNISGYIDAGNYVFINNSGAYSRKDNINVWVYYRD